MISKEELEERIKHKENVYIPIIDYYIEDTSYIKEIKLTNKHYISVYDGHISLMYIDKDGYNTFEDYIEHIHSTREKAQHYLDNAKVTRLEKLPFMTWEEFIKNPYILFTCHSDFYNVQGAEKLYSLTISDNKLLLKDECEIALEEWDVNENNFYEAYKIMKKLFLGF